MINTHHPRPPRSLARRAVLRGGGSVLATLATLATPTIVRAADQPGVEKELVFACPGGATQKEFETKFFPEFQDRTGIKVTYFPGQPAEILAQLRLRKGNQSIDAIWIGGGFTYQAIDEHLVAPFDPGLMPNLALIAPAARSSETAMTPIGLSPCGLLNNTTQFAQHAFPTPTSWLDMWDPRYKAHVGLYSINSAGTTVALVMIAKILTGDYRNIDAAFAKMRELRPNILNFFGSAGAWETSMQQGDLWLGVNNAGRAMQLRNAGMPVGFPKLKEGTVAYRNWLGIVNGAPHPKAAHAWINYMLSTEAQFRMATTIGYNPVNGEVKAPADLAVYFPAFDDIFIPDGRYLADQLPNFVARWNREIEG